MSRYFGHSGSGRGGNPELLAEHLQLVSKRAAEFASPWGAARVAEIAGLLHDLGKYSQRFQRRLKGLESGLDHWSSGAWAALLQYKHEGVAPALAVQGHHVGLQRADADSIKAIEPARLYRRHPLGLRVPEETVQDLLQRMLDDQLALPGPDPAYGPSDESSLVSMLATRMLFSALTDADYLETEAHFEGDNISPRRYREPAPDIETAKALEQLLARIGTIAKESTADYTVNSVRADLLAASLKAATREPGLFTLTAPTGSGKTLAMLAFALEHARLHGLRRVITVVPYLTIIEQTVRVYQSELDLSPGSDYLLEHHSLADVKSPVSPSDEDGQDNEYELTRRRRMLAENWDAPVIVTTSVQMLESLFSNRPSACRKLHRLARSVILFDEVQTLPPRLIVPTLGALAALCAKFGSTVVFATATQPAFGHLDGAVKKHVPTGWKPHPIVDPGLELFDRTRRVIVSWPDLEKPTSWSDLRELVLREEQALCVVNLKRHAVELVGALSCAAPQEGLFHLSTAMCPRHRERTLDQVRSRLTERQRCVLVSTQCVEAGVDVDFPSVLRAFGPLDAIAQAAGRCNRNGRLPRAQSCVRVFLPEDERYPPGGGYGQAAGVTRMLLREKGTDRMDINDPALFEDYYRRLFDLTQPETLNRELLEAIQARDFPAVAKEYRVVDQDSVNVLVAFDLDEFHALEDELQSSGTLTREWMRRARRSAVSLFRSEVEHTPNIRPAPLMKGGFSTDWYISTRPEDYDQILGYKPSAEFFL